MPPREEFPSKGVEGAPNVSSVRSRDTNFYYRLLDEVVEEIGEKYIVQIVTDNEAALKASTSTRAWKQMNPDNSDNEMNVERSRQSQERNVSHSSSSPTPSQSDDGGGLSPDDDGDGDGDGDGANFGDNMDANRPYSPLEGEFGLAATGGLFINMAEYGGNPFAESSEGQSARTARSKGKAKKHHYEISRGSSSSGERSNSSNFEYSESSASTQRHYYPPEQHNFQPPHGYPPPYGYYPPQMYPPPSQIYPPPQMYQLPQMYPPPQMYHPQIYPPPRMYQEQRSQGWRWSQLGSQSEDRESDPPRHSTMW
ncbi:uncharacterized protein LOC111306591 [Durio zibethinus]|uniref:Uncharacterized protein LOC111306591 n=1 Tax=Durio zibethinus TaxID=66656 RepID=A0A6P6A5R7_DURZI|nr:uncharacterized protein LOC111306591 [Durio zibethinus]